MFAYVHAQMVQGHKLAGVSSVFANIGVVKSLSVEVCVIYFPNFGLDFAKKIRRSEIGKY